MMRQTDYLDRIWRRTIQSFFGVLAVLIFVLGINFWDASKSGNALPWDQVGIALGFMAYGCLILAASWLIYKFIRRRAEHYEKQE
jgi:hypothetical protein